MYKVIINEQNRDIFNYQKEKYKNEILADVLSKRDIHFDLSSVNDSLSSPFKFSQMKKTSEYLDNLLKNNPEELIVNGDYDSDGFHGTYIFVQFIKEKYNITLDYYINNKHKDGYELSPEVVQKFYDMGKRTILTIDKAIGSYSGVKKAKELGMTVIITDHHMPKYDEDKNPIILEADYIICHTLEEEPMELCGAATVWYLCRALDDQLAMKFVDSAAIATIGDMVSMKDNENRKIVLKGIEAIQKKEFSNKNYAKFFERAYPDLDTVCSDTFGFLIVPIINSACRYEKSSDTIAKFISDDLITFKDIDSLIALNQQRKEDVFNLSKKLHSMIIEEDNFIIVKGDSIDIVLLGLVASRIQNEYSKTTFVMNEGDTKLKCSGRSADYDLQEIFSSKYKTTIKGGGHRAAVGFEIEKNEFDLFKKDLKEHVVSEAIIYADGFIKNFNFITTSLIESLDILGPYGQQFQEPTYVFSLDRVKIENISTMSNGQHLRFNIITEAAKLTCVNFSTNFSYVDIKNLHNYLAIGSMKLNHFRGSTTVQILINNFIKKDDYKLVT